MLNMMNKQRILIRQSHRAIARQQMKQPSRLRNHVSYETVRMVHPDDEALGEAEAIKRSMEQFQELTELRRIEREVNEYMASVEAELGPLDLDEDEPIVSKIPKRTAADIHADTTLDPIKKAALLAAAAATATSTTVGQGSKDMSRLYIPPAQRRGGMSSSGDIEANSTIKVTNYDDLMASEEMMRDMFENFGRIIRVSMTTIRERDGYRYPATFIKFQLKGSAEDAIQRLHGKPVRSAILSVEVAEERGPRPGPVSRPVNQRCDLTGYGKELAASTLDRCDLTGVARSAGQGQGFASLNSVWA